MSRFRLTVMAAAATGLLLYPLGAIPSARAQGWFVPNNPAPAQPRPAPTHHLRPSRVAPPPSEPLPAEAPPGEADAEAQQPLPPLPEPPVPALPPLAKGPAPPTPVIGVLGVPEIMRASTAAQEVQKVIGGRRDKLNHDAQREQTVWRQMQESLQNDAPHLTQEQGRARQRALQERITNAQREFRARNRIVQEAAQVAIGQIERTLIAVIRQVAESRGMNLVLHRSQVALNVAQFDITDEVTAQMNKVLPSVEIPADGVDPATLVKQNGGAAPVTPSH